MGSSHILVKPMKTTTKCTQDMAVSKVFRCEFRQEKFYFQMIEGTLFLTSILSQNTKQMGINIMGRLSGG